MLTVIRSVSKLRTWGVYMKIHVPKLYHISFKLAEEEIWTPRTPDSGGEGKKIIGDYYEEPAIERICCSETLAGCFMAVYPNVYNYFEDEFFNYPYMDFYYYSPLLPKTMDTKDILDPEILTEKEYVWDAHLTREWSILIPIKMQHVGSVRFFNTVKKRNWVKTYPFNNKRYKEKIVCPSVEYNIIKR